MDQWFRGKVSLVTGAAAGIGYATAKMFAEAGASVALLDANGEAVSKAAESLAATGHKAVGLKCDVSDESEVKANVERTTSIFGRLDAACNNAGIHVPAVEMADAKGTDFDHLMSINLRGVWNCMKYELEQMRQQGGGSIVNVSSTNGLIGNAGLWRVYSFQAWRDWTHQERGTGVCREGYTSECRLPRSYHDSNARAGDRRVSR